MRKNARNQPDDKAEGLDRTGAQRSQEGTEPADTKGGWQERLAGRWISPKGRWGDEWFSRGYVPHREGRDLIQHVTLHLADSLATDARERIERSLSVLPANDRDAERRRRLQDWLDAGHGCCVLGRPEIANLTQAALLYFHGERYRMHAWAVMPNHWHALFEPIGGWTVAQVVTSWKRYTARRIRAWLEDPTANRETPGNAAFHSGSRGSAAPATSPFPRTVWHREYWDRYIRNERHYGKAVEYIHSNPAKAGLCLRPENWPWSSAGRAESCSR